MGKLVLVLRLVLVFEVFCRSKTSTSTRFGTGTTFNDPRRQRLPALHTSPFHVIEEAVKFSRSCIALPFAAFLILAFGGCNHSSSKPDRPATVSTVAKEKHTKTKAHKREKKKEKEEGKKTPKAAPATPTPAQ